MANDCLVTKLKSTVDNSNLEKLGQLKLKVSHKNSEGRLGFYMSFSNYPVYLTIEGDGDIIYDDINCGKNAEIINSNTITLSNPAEGSSYNLFIDSKYSIRNYNDGNEPLSLDASSLNYNNSLKEFTKRYTGEGSKGIFKPIDESSLNNVHNLDTNISVVLDGVGTNMRKLHGYYDIPENVFNTIAPTLTEFDMLKQQSYLPDAAILTCEIWQPNNVSQKVKFVWGTKTGAITNIVNVNLGNLVDKALKNLAQLNSGGTVVALWGTSNHATDAEVQAAIHTLINDKGITNLQINGV